MTNELKKILEIAVNELQHTDTLALQEIKAICSKALLDNEIKHTLGTTTLKRSRAMQKYLDKKENRDILKKAFIIEINNIKYQTVSDGYSAILIEKHFDNIEINADTIQLQGIIKTLTDSILKISEYSKIEYDISDIKSQLIEHKANNNKNKKIPCEFKLSNGVTIDLKRFEEIYNILGNDIKIFSSGKLTDALVMQNNNSYAVLCPIRPRY